MLRRNNFLHNSAQNKTSFCCFKSPSATKMKQMKPCSFSLTSPFSSFSFFSLSRRNNISPVYDKNLFSRLNISTTSFSLNLPPPLPPNLSNNDNNYDGNIYTTEDDKTSAIREGRRGSRPMRNFRSRIDTITAGVNTTTDRKSFSSVSANDNDNDTYDNAPNLPISPYCFETGTLFTNKTVIRLLNEACERNESYRANPVWISSQTVEEVLNLDILTSPSNSAIGVCLPPIWGNTTLGARRYVLFDTLTDIDTIDGIKKRVKLPTDLRGKKVNEGGDGIIENGDDDLSSREEENRDIFDLICGIDDNNNAADRNKQYFLSRSWNQSKKTSSFHPFKVFKTHHELFESAYLEALKNYDKNCKNGNNIDKIFSPSNSTKRLNKSNLSKLPLRPIWIPLQDLIRESKFILSSSKRRKDSQRNNEKSAKAIMLNDSCIMIDNTINDDMETDNDKMCIDYSDDDFSNFSLILNKLTSDVTCKENGINSCFALKYSVRLPSHSGINLINASQLYQSKNHPLIERAFQKAIYLICNQQNKKQSNRDDFCNKRKDIKNNFAAFGEIFSSSEKFLYNIYIKHLSEHVQKQKAQWASLSNNAASNEKKITKIKLLNPMNDDYELFKATSTEDEELKEMRKIEDDGNYHDNNNINKNITNINKTGYIITKDQWKGLEKISAKSRKMAFNQWKRQIETSLLDTADDNINNDISAEEQELNEMREIPLFSSEVCYKDDIFKPELKSLNDIENDLKMNKKNGNKNDNKKNIMEKYSSKFEGINNNVDSNNHKSYVSFCKEC